MDLVAVSLDRPSLASEARKRSGASFRFVADPHGELVDRLGLRHVGGNPAARDGQSEDIARSALVLVGGDGIVHWTHLATNYRVRPSAESVLESVRRALGAAAAGEVGG